ncbi:MAG: HlyD family type I secretion periplasmic adaptor subunit [Gemmatimonadaceae bacterium]|nr:HlyD family type I secretion periplasmic adaptor subunit [Caulobacter sp.]
MTPLTAFMETSPLTKGLCHIANARRDILLGGAAATLFFVGFVGWAASAPLDSAAHATGQVAVSGSRQQVQNLEGGEISALLVKEGDVVAAGQPLVELNAAEARAAERALAAQVIQHQAQISRIQAETLGRPFEALRLPASASPEDRALAAEAEIMARRELAARDRAYATEQAVLSRRVDQLHEQITGGRVQSAANERQQGLMGQELSGMRRLADQGYAPLTRVRALERAAAELEGANGVQRGEIARLGAGVGEIRLQMSQTSAERARLLAAETRQAQSELSSLIPQWEAAKQRLEASRIKAPVSGTVMGVTVHTVGGVVAAGQNLMEIVPVRPSLTMDVRVPARDVEGLSAGQAVEIKFPSLTNRRTPVLMGSLAVLSPDTLVDEKTGATFYTARAVVSEVELLKLNRGEASPVRLRPGMPVEVLIRKRKKSLLGFWFEPLMSSLWSQGG